MQWGQQIEINSSEMKDNRFFDAGVANGKY